MIEVRVHSFDETECNRPPIPETEPFCGHGWAVHTTWVPPEVPC